MSLPSSARHLPVAALLGLVSCYTSHDWDVDGFDAGEDCDDGDASIHPGAEETCDDGLDNNCDGLVDECCGLLDLGRADAVFSGPSQTSKAGSSLNGGEDLDGDGIPDLLIGAPHALDLRGAVYLISGSNVRNSALPGNAAVLHGGLLGARAGTSVASVGDFDGDGQADLLVGAPGAGNKTEGAAFLVLGPVTDSLSLDDADATWTSPTTGAHMGLAVAGGEDLDGDGRSEILLVAGGEEGDEASVGGAYLVYGRARDGDSLPHAAEDLELDLSADTDRKPAAAAMAGDVDGDGFTEVLVGLPGRSPEECGIARLILGPELDTRYDFQASVCESSGQNGGVGTQVAGAGDVDADGYDDILVGAPADSTYTTLAGRVYLVLGSAEDLDPDLGEAPAKLEGERAYHRAGVAAGPGDVNGDGKDDILVGASNLRQEDGSMTGAAYLVYGPATGALSIAHLIDLGDAELRMLGEGDEDQAGYSLSGAGDIDQDGLVDFLIGAPGHGSGNLTEQGAAYLVLGQDCVE